jgi:hypothetical protein
MAGFKQYRSQERGTEKQERKRSALKSAGSSGKSREKSVHFSDQIDHFHFFDNSTPI